MASNLVSDVMKMATPAVIDRMAAAQGVGSDVVRHVLASAVPGIFAGIAKQAGTSAGLGNIVAGLQQADPDLPAKLLPALDGGAQSPFVAGGTEMLRQVAGDSALNAIVGTISKSTGVSPAVCGRLVAVAGQMAMSALGKQASGLDPDGLLALLGSQMKAFQSSLPAGLASALGFANSGGSPAVSTAPAPAAIRDPAQAAAKASRELTDDSGGSGWLMWLVPVIVIAAALWYYLGHKQSAMITEPPPQTSTSKPANPAPDLVIGSVDVGKLLSSGMTGLSEALAGVSDAASAKAAAPKLSEIATDLAQVSGLATKFTPDQKKAVAALVNAGLPQLKELAAKVEAEPGAGDIVKPVIDPVIAQLEALAKG